MSTEIERKYMHVDWLTVAIDYPPGVIAHLAKDIRKNGMHEPVIVYPKGRREAARPYDPSDDLIVLDGGKRLAAVKKLGNQAILCTVLPKRMSRQLAKHGVLTEAMARELAEFEERHAPGGLGRLLDTLRRAGEAA